MQKRKPNKAESEHMDRVQQIGCIVCFDELETYSPALVHHCDTGMGRKKDHYKTIPLCSAHHDYHSKIGRHGMGRKAWGKKFNTEEYYLNLVAEILGLTT